MNKDLKDYLHFYLGCDVTDGENVMKLLTVGIHGYDAANDDVRSRGMFHRIKPILRPLSSMTEEEVVELFKLLSLWDLSECKFEHGVDDGNFWCNAETSHVIDSIMIIGDRVEMMNNEGDFSPINPMSTAFHWMLSKHFDLFNLIPEGLAIDKTSISNL